MATSVDGNDSFVGVERLKFLDFNIALDINGNAGITSKVLGAVFGKGSIENKAYVGIGISLLDGGMSYQDLMQLAIDARLGANVTNTSVVNLLYTNVIGTAPSRDDLTYFSGQIENGLYSQASLGIMAAETSLNASNINLVGLAATGVEFI